MGDELLVVQFPHPGAEHRPDSGRLKEWNLGAHARKFMRVRGRWLETSDLRHEREGAIVFWGEWEPQSFVIESYRPSDAGWPHFVQIPFWVPPSDSAWRQNTDPYVFGERFLYSNCRQNSKQGPRRTQRLALGSLILFGSTLRGEFVLDTVFIVSASEPMSWESLGALHEVDDTFRAVVAEPLYSMEQDRSRSYRFYGGARPSDPVAGMFSFFPCMPFADAPKGFPRPSIQLQSVVNPASSRNTKFTRIVSLVEVREIWEAVSDQVLEQGLLLGVYAGTPASFPTLESALSALKAES